MRAAEPLSEAERPAVQLRHISKRFNDEYAVDDVSLRVKDGEFVTLLGPSGCGKTTTLRCIAGLELPDAGEILIGEQLAASPKSGVHLNPEERNIGMVFQSYAVWPHMTVFENVAYGLRVRRASGETIKKKTCRALELVGLEHLGDRYASKLSGGQRQRVALARAIVYEPRVLLFDEPLSNLDAKLREQMRTELVRLQREVGITSIYVTHDQSEALVMSDRVVVMNRGKIQQVGDPHTIYAHPETAFVASFIGATNLLDCILVKRSGSHCQVEVPLGAGQAAASVLAMSAERTPLRERLVLSIRPEDIALHIIAPPPAGEMNCLQGEVVNTVYLGSFLECRVRVGMHELTVQLQHFAELASGQRVFLTFSADHGLCLMGDGLGPENDELRRRADPLARIGPTMSA